MKGLTMKRILSLLLINTLVVFNFAYAADNITVPTNEGKAYLTDSLSRLWPAEVVYTTDGSGNIIPISGGGGGGGPAHRDHALPEGHRADRREQP